MKKNIALVFILFLAFIGLPTRAFAQTSEQNPDTVSGETMEKTVATGGATMEDIQQDAGDYALPYPGILPDHPLYGLKRLRDKILDMLIVDQTRKAEFYVLQSDKHLNMTIFLLDKGKEEHAISTTEASVDYLENAIMLLAKAKDGAAPMPEYVRDRTERSAVKHVTVFSDLAESTANQVSEALRRAAEESNRLREQANGLK